MQATRTIKVLFASLTVVAVIAMGSNVFAERGGRYRGCDGNGQYQGRGDCAGGQRWADLTDEQQEQLKAERNAFFDATRDLRGDLNAKRLALKAEIAKSEPDMEAAMALQKEISELQADLAQKRLTHLMAVRKINPDAGGRFMDGGRGYHHGRGKRMGGGGGGCPYAE